MRLPEIYTILQREHHISPGDFPNVTKMQVQTNVVFPNVVWLLTGVQLTTTNFGLRLSWLKALCCMSFPSLLLSALIFLQATYQ